MNKYEKGKRARPSLSRYAHDAARIAFSKYHICAKRSRELTEAERSNQLLFDDMERIKRDGHGPRDHGNTAYQTAEIKLEILKKQIKLQKQQQEIEFLNNAIPIFEEFISAMELRKAELGSSEIGTPVFRRQKKRLAEAEQRAAARMKI